ncbi:SpaA isopeptide-forming pilin-related protein [Collinsella aerofaciens]|uniref:SpaA isopeptide-forming pilin-related protein n=1 Tax=Collinsella aerofaciens TaxID=74426 RepID=UPI00232AD68B|nr:SpaA isopeptide-forming pilin-related protein [Collinsella aerofaciens]MDB1906597.1 SpaA isopeptide-forming pilin-related protein [Collinsella aerofaciens]
MSKNIARLAVTAGLTAALSFGGVMAPVTMAFAAEGATGSITINKVNDANKDNTFKAYQIFKAKVVDEKDKGKVASDIKWANNIIGSKVITAITGSTEYQELVKKDPTKKLKDDPSASDVAEWLSQNVTGTSASTATTGGTRVASGSVLNSIAKAVAKDETAVGSSFKAGEEWTRPDDSGDGYYLFVSDGLTDSIKPNTGTSPIFAIVGGNSVVVTEKTSIPTVEKKILDDNAGTDATSDEEKNWKDSGDAWIGQEIGYRLTGRVADNIASYDTYYYEFKDTLSKGLKVVKNSDDTLKDLHVYIDNNGSKKEVAPDADKGYKATVTPVEADGTELLNVSFKNLKTVQTAKGEPIEVGAASKVVVTYKAQLTSDVEYKAGGTTNEVKLFYSNNPMTDDKGTSESDKVTDYVFGLDVTKTDADPNNANAKLVARFKVKMTKEGNTDISGGGKWLTQEGGLTSEASEAGVFATETDNKVFIPGLVAGEYQIIESEAPAGYNTIDPFTITVAPKYDSTGTLERLDVTSSSEMAVAKTEKDLTTTKIPVTIKNKKGSGLPLTGLNGVTFTWIAGGAVLCIGVAHLIRSRKQAEESEQE